MMSAMNLDQSGGATSPLASEMANAAFLVLARIVVRAPVLEPEVEKRDQAMHELIARCGIKLRAPFTLLALQRGSSAARPTEQASVTASKRLDVFAKRA